MNKDGTGYRVLYKFSPTGGDGRNPFGAVIEATDGALYGTTRGGGSSGYGTVFKLNKNGSGYTILHSLQGSPDEGAGCFAGLLEASDGVLYGTTIQGGSYGDGTVFSLNKDGSNFQTLHHFQGGGADGVGPRGGLVEGLDEALYGTTTYGGASNAGCVFKLNKDGSSYALLHSFGADADDGRTPTATLASSRNGVLYGSTYEGGLTNARASNGTVFKVSADGSQYSVLHKFAGPPDDGRTPWGALLEGNDGALYGTTLSGGAQQYGTVFKLASDGGSYTILHHFTMDGLLPNAGLIQTKDGTLYGTTRDGGASRNGTAFKLNTDGTGYSVLHDFNFSGGDGYYPVSLVLGTNGALYGLTQMGGDHGDGAAFKLTPDGGDYRLLHSFSFDGGRVPFGISAATDGNLYGTTYQGGTNDLGTIFKLGQDGSNFSVLRYFGDFPGEGAHPLAGLLNAHDGMLYGTTRDNGFDGGSGTVFRLDPARNSYDVLHAFGSIDPDGQHPYAALIEGTDGVLYGTTFDGGNTGYGAVFKLNKDGTSYTLLHNFSTLSGEGQNPWRLLEASDGMLYGTTFYGGTNGSGTVFRLNKNGTGYSVLYSFAGGPFNANPNAPLWEGDDGALYGTTRRGGGVENAGSVFKLNKDGSDFEVVHSFNITDDGGYESWNGLFRGPDGALYGTTYYGGELGLGTVFKLWPPQTPDILGIRVTNSTLQVTFAGAANYHYQILRSTDLKNWIIVDAITMPTGGLYTYMDPSPPTRSAFYRATWAP